MRVEIQANENELREKSSEVVYQLADCLKALHLVSRKRC